MTVDELLKLIEIDLEKALSELDKLCEKRYGDYNDLNEKYINRAENFSKNEFRSQLKRFVSYNKKEIESILKDMEFENKSHQDEIFELLCKLDFTHQTEYFNSLINSNKTFLSFVIRGEEENYGQEWLANQLIHQYRKSNKPIHKTFFLDFEELNLDLSTFLDSLIKIFGANEGDTLKNKKTNIRRSLEKRIETGSQFIIIKNAYKFIHSEEFDDFIQIFCYFYNELSGIEHKCIFFFLEKMNSEPYEHTQFCVLSDTISPFTFNGFTEFKFIIFNKIIAITIQELRKWIEYHCPSQARNHFEGYLCNELELSELLADGNPQKLIPEICAKIGENYFEYENKWLKN